LEKEKNMIYFKRCVIILLSVLLSSPILFAEDDKFPSTSEEMVKELTRSPVKYRSFGTTKKRAIKVVQRVNNQIEEKVVMIDENADVPRLKLKIEFDYNSSALKNASYTLLKEVGKALMSDQLRYKDIMINGHTDSDGAEQYNLKLSFDRADSVKAYLVTAFDIPENRLLIRGYGELLPLKPNTDSYNKQINRRVEFEINN
jgi:outer membrane protein OmpA-like peptidoglycan-associated protein